MKTPKISVIMSVYNGNVQHLREAIDSILNQTFSDFEFIIINDGSTDPKIEKTIKSYVDKRIKYFYKPNGGIIDSLNYGLDRSNGEYIARMDADDISLPHRFVMQVKFLDENPDVSLVGAGMKIFGDIDQIIVHPENPKCMDIVRACPFVHPVVMIRSNDIEKHGFRYRTDYLVAQDYELWGRMIRVLKMANLPYILLNYRRSGQNITSTKAAIAQKETELVQKAMLDFLSTDKNVQEALKNINLHVAVPQEKKIKTKKYGITLLKIKKTETYRKYYLLGFIQVLSIEKILD